MKRPSSAKKFPALAAWLGRRRFWDNLVAYVEDRAASVRKKLAALLGCSLGRKAFPSRLSVLLQVENLELRCMPNVAPNVIEFHQDNFDFHHPPGTAVIEVDRVGDLSTPASVDYSTSDGTAISRVDYTATSGTLTFAIGQVFAAAYFYVPILDDPSPPPTNDYLNLHLSNPSPGWELGSDAATLTIIPFGTLTASTTPATDHAVEGTVSDPQVVATFTDSVFQPTSYFSGTIDWGDGSSEPFDASAVNWEGGLTYTVNGSHLYKDEGSYLVVVSIDDTEGTSAVAHNTTFAVADAALAAEDPQPNDLSAVEGAMGTFTVETFTCSVESLVMKPRPGS